MAQLRNSIQRHAITAHRNPNKTTFPRVKSEQLRATPWKKRGRSTSIQSLNQSKLNQRRSKAKHALCLCFIPSIAAYSLILLQTRRSTSSPVSTPSLRQEVICLVHFHPTRPGEINKNRDFGTVPTLSSCGDENKEVSGGNHPL
jgi:hypothetical protein